MLIEHNGKRPQIHSAAWIASDATVCGDIEIGAGTRVLYGARIIGEAGGPFVLGAIASSWRMLWCAAAASTFARSAITADWT